MELKGVGRKGTQLHACLMISGIEEGIRKKPKI